MTHGMWIPSVALAALTTWAMDSATSAAIADGAGPTTARCTMGHFGTPPPPIPTERVITFLGSGLADTVAAPHADALTGTVSGFDIPTRDPTMFGQMVNIERLSVRRPADMPAGATKVVLVPWAYGPNCGITRWRQSARWLPVGARGILYGSLRDRRHWVQGTPTADVWITRSHPIWPEPPADAPGASRITAADAIDMLDALPPDSVLVARPDEGFALFLSRLAARPALQAKAEQNIVAAREHIRNLFAPLVPVPAAGTYRVEMRTAEGATGIVYIRTSASPAGATALYHPPGADSTRPRYDALMLAPSAVALPISKSANQQHLASGTMTESDAWSGGGRLQISASGVPNSQGGVKWHGSLIFSTAGVVLSAPLAPASGTSADGRLAESVSIDALLIEQTPDGRFIIPATDVSTYRGTLHISGERVSSATFSLIKRR